jgi:hypothetical protein
MRWRAARDVAGCECKYAVVVVDCCEVESGVVSERERMRVATGLGDSTEYSWTISYEMKPKSEAAVLVSSKDITSKHAYAVHFCINISIEIEDGKCWHQALIPSRLTNSMTCPANQYELALGLPGAALASSNKLCKFISSPLTYLHSGDDLQSGSRSVSSAAFGHDSSHSAKRSVTCCHNSRILLLSPRVTPMIGCPSMTSATTCPNPQLFSESPVRRC